MAENYFCSRGQFIPDNNAGIIALLQRGDQDTFFAVSILFSTLQHNASHMSFSRLYYTLRPLRWQQFWYRFYHPLRKQFYKAPRVPAAAMTAAADWPKLPLATLPVFDTYNPLDNSFELLHISRSYPGSINWNDQQHGLLWAYHLNYFGWLQDERIHAPDRLQAILDYTTAAQSDRIVTGLAAYPISLRGINWIRFFLQQGICNAAAAQVLYIHYDRLCTFPEYHLQGNHLWENGCSLLFAGHYFADARFYRKGRQIMQQAIAEQLFEDGGHVEGSPMYHSLLLSRLLQCIEFLQRSPHFRDKTFVNKLLLAAGRMLRWLQAMTFSNGHYPMINDSTGFMAPDLKELTTLAEACGITLPPAAGLSDSGYRMVKTKYYELFIDVSAIRPSYQPGHAHADTFSFCLVAGGRDIIVDPGVSTYAQNAARQWQRGTGAHNTVQVNERNSSDIWKSFRMGRRAEIVSLEETADSLIARHDGYQDLGITHCRSFKFLENKIIIEDTLEGMKEENALLCLHFHTDVIPESLTEFRYVAGNLLLRIENAKEATIMSYDRALGFNKTVKATKLCIRLNASTRITLELLHAD